MAACHEKTARAYIKKSVTEGVFTEASIKRLMKTTNVDGMDDMAVFK